jgi:hypothetical protein
LEPSAAALRTNTKLSSLKTLAVLVAAQQTECFQPASTCKPGDAICRHILKPQPLPAFLQGLLQHSYLHTRAVLAKRLQAASVHGSYCSALSNACSEQCSPNCRCAPCVRCTYEVGQPSRNSSQLRSDMSLSLACPSARLAGWPAVVDCVHTMGCHGHLAPVHTQPQSLCVLGSNVPSHVEHSQVDHSLHAYNMLNALNIMELWTCAAKCAAPERFAGTAPSTASCRIAL